MDFDPVWLFGLASVVAGFASVVAAITRLLRELRKWRPGRTRPRPRRIGERGGRRVRKEHGVQNTPRSKPGNAT
jgi:hypothetical protein